jgi:mitogen-activated protein kinase organizer 1
MTSSGGGSSSSGIRCEAKLSGHKGAVNAVAFNSDGGYCLTGGEDRRVLLWNPWRELADGASHLPIKAYTVHNQRVLDVCIAQDNASFASCGGDRTVFVWDVTSGSVTRRLIGHEQRVNCVRYSHDCAVLLSASYDKTVRCWDMRSKSTAPIQVLQGAADSVSAVCSSGHEIFAGSIDGSVLTYDLRKGSLLRDTVGPPVGHVSLSGDQNCILCGTLDSTLRLLDKASGQVLCEYRGHRNEAYKLACCLSQDDSKVLSGSEEGTLHVWDLVEGKQLLKKQVHAGPVVALCCHPKSSAVLTGSHDGTCKLWVS